MKQLFSPKSSIAIAREAIEICSPDVRSISSSLLLGESEISYALFISESVVPAGAETTTITLCPSFLYFKTLLATSSSFSPHLLREQT